MSTKSATVTTPFAALAAFPAAAAVRVRALASPAVPAPPPVSLGAGAAMQARTTPWLTVAVLLALACLAWTTIATLTGHRDDATRPADAGPQRSERFWRLHDAALEATLAVTLDLAGGAPPPEGGLQADARRLAQACAALRSEMSRPGGPLLAQEAAWSDAAAALFGAVRDDSPPPDPRGDPHPRVQARAALDTLVRLGHAVSERERAPAVEGGSDGSQAWRRQVLLAFSAVVAALVLVLGLAARWLLIARRERALRVRAEQLVEAAQAERARAEALARDKARFLGMLSHELLTPLQSIWSTMDVIEARGRIDASEPAFGRLKESTRSLQGRISDLVDFAKVSSGRLETRIRGFQLDKLIDAALRDLEEVLATRNLDVHWEAGPELSHRLYSDPARLRQIVDNLLTNAIKYTERGGISIEARLDRDRGVLAIEIADTGVGIHPDAMARLFEPFYRSPQTVGMAEGSGLGLAVVRSLVDLMGGTIRVDSKLGQGTAVTVEVPISEGGEGGDDAIESPTRLDTRRPVLVVDDSQDARRAIGDVIRALGIEVVEAVDGPTGLAAAAERDYLAIFLDMQMPGLTGYEVARRLRRAGQRHARTYLALISAYNELDDATIASVFDARIDKPVSRAALVDALGHASRQASRG